MSRSQSPFLLLVLLSVCIGLSPSQPSFGHSGDVLSAWAVSTPTIDGSISTGEWIDAAAVDFTLGYCSETHDVTLYVKNDDTYLYLAAVVRNEEYSNLAEMYHDFANFYFDNNNNATVEVGEDGLAIRFDNTVFRDTHNPNGVNGWSYSDDTEGGTNDIDGAATHTNPVPDGVGDYTFEYRHPLDSTDSTHDFSLSPGDTVGFRFSFPDGETDCQPVGYHWPSSSPTSYGDILIASEAYVKLLFVPMNWTNTQAAFDSQVDTQVGVFTSAIPLSACPERISVTKLDVATQNFSTFTCTFPTNCGVGSIAPFVSGLGISTADYDVVVGLIEDSPCPPIAGCSNGTDAVWVETDYDSVLAHELGHIYGLEDEYCSNRAGSTDERCNDGGVAADYDGDTVIPAADLNPLHDETSPHPCDCPPDGSNASDGDPCCNTTFWNSCTTANYAICCRGNYASTGGVAVMSYANAEDRFAGTRAFDEHSEAHFATLPELTCSSPEKPIAREIIDLRLDIYPDDEVVDKRIIRTFGRPTRYYHKHGNYTLEVIGQQGKVLFSQIIEITFDYNGPVYDKTDYSRIRYSKFPLSFRIHYNPAMYELRLRHGEEVIFSRELNFCDDDGVCESTETYDTCPRDCPLEKNDKLCRDRKDSVCDPDCRAGVDPDCEGECGNAVCNSNEDYGKCPKDCSSGGSDRYCDGKEDERCDPDCTQEEDPDCQSDCGDGVCASCENAVDPYACENHDNCREDCRSGGEDRYCDGVQDEICDPDCRAAEDPDCPKIGRYVIWIVVLLVFLLIVVLYFALRSKG